MRCLRRRFPWSSDSLRERYFGLEQQVPNSSEFVTGMLALAARRCLRKSRSCIKVAHVCDLLA